MQNYLSVNKADLEYNAKNICDYVKTPVIGVVKCNGYGCGIENAVNAWISAGVTMIAASESDEIEQIINMGLSGTDIMLLTPCSDKSAVEHMAKNGVIFTVTNVETAKLLIDVCVPLSITPRAHVKIDTGMGRFGTRYDDIDAIKRIYSIEGIDYCGIFSHFAASFEQNYDKTKMQLDRFLSVTDELKKSGIDVGLRHIANSSAALCYEQTRLDAVRIGSALVGRLIKKPPIDLKRIGVFYAQAVDEITLKKGDTSGYAMIYKAKRDMKCAVIEIGMHHGFGVSGMSDNFRFVDLLRDIYHAITGFKKPLFVTDKNGARHKVVGRIGNQFTLVENDDGSIKSGDTVSADMNVLYIDADVERVLE